MSDNEGTRLLNRVPPVAVTRPNQEFAGMESGIQVQRGQLKFGAVGSAADDAAKSAICGDKPDN